MTRPAIEGKLKQTLESTNPCESMVECVRRSSSNVKCWRDGEMALRGMLETERQFRRVIGCARDRYRVIVRSGPPSKFHDRAGHALRNRGLLLRS